MESHLRALGFSVEVSTLSFSLFGRDDPMLFVEFHDIVVHDFHSQELFLQQLFLIDNKGLGFANGASNLLSGSHRLLLQFHFPFVLLLNLLLEFHLDKHVVAHFLLFYGELFLSVQLNFLRCLRLFVQSVDFRRVVIV